MDQYRVCETCGISKPLSTEYYKRATGSYLPRCRNCIKAEQKARAKRDKQRRKAALAKVEADGVDFWLSQVKAGGSNIPHSAEVVERVIEYFGGTSGFSAMLVKQYYDATPGGTTRSRLLETICRLVAKNTDQGGAKRPLSMWSEDELEQELQARLTAAAKIVQGEVVGGKKSKKAASAGRLEAPRDPEAGAAHPVREGRAKEPAKRASRTEDRSAEALPPESESRGDSRLHGERDSGDRGESVG